MIYVISIEKNRGRRLSAVGLSKIRQKAFRHESDQSHQPSGIPRLSDGFVYHFFCAIDVKTIITMYSPLVNRVRITPGDPVAGYIILNCIMIALKCGLIN